MATTLQLPFFLGTGPLNVSSINVVWNLFCGIVEKTSCLLDRKVRWKNQISEYHTPSSKGYNEEDTRSIDEKHPNPMGY